MSRARDARTWLNANGVNVGPKGRIPADKLAVYEAHMAKIERGARGAGQASIATPTGKRNAKGWTCGFCTPTLGQPRGCYDTRHLCKGEYQNGSAAESGPVAYCQCAVNDHPSQWPLAWPRKVSA